MSLGLGRSLRRQAGLSPWVSIVPLWAPPRPHTMLVSEGLCPSPSPDTRWEWESWGGFGPC